jgi:putative Holliday junction resolvase
MMNRIMGLDIGDATIGIALSDESRTIASPVENYRRQGLKKDLNHLIALVLEWEATTIVAGMPYHMNGTLGSQGEKTMSFIGHLRKKIIYGGVLDKAIEIVTWDERLSTRSATAALIKGDVSRKDRKSKVDMVAAAIILQNYLDHQKTEGSHE